MKHCAISFTSYGVNLYEVNTIYNHLLLSYKEAKN